MIPTDESGFHVQVGASASFVPEEDYHDFRLLYASTKGVCRVFTARKRGKRFIVKTLREPYNDNPQATALLRKEFDISFHLDSPFIARTYDFVTLPALGPSIIQEYVPGETLHEIIATGRQITAQQTDSIVNQLAEALNHIHSRGINHLDLKPSNIVFDSASNRLQLIDFGLADSEEYYLFNNAGETQGYVPEDKNVTPARRDLYAFGVTLGELEGIAPADRRKALKKLSESLTDGTIRNSREIAPIYRKVTTHSHKWVIAACGITAAAVIIAVLLNVNRTEDQIEPVDVQELTALSTDTAEISADAKDDGEAPAISNSPKSTIVEETKEMPEPIAQIAPGIPVPPADTVKNGYGVSLTKRNMWHSSPTISLMRLWSSEPMH